MHLGTALHKEKDCFCPQHIMKRNSALSHSTACRRGRWPLVTTQQEEEEEEEEEQQQQEQQEEEATSSHNTAWRSRWFVGSSSNSRSGSTNRARASAIRILQPPEKVLVHLICSETATNFAENKGEEAENREDHSALLIPVNIGWTCNTG